MFYFLAFNSGSVLSGWPNIYKKIRAVKLNKWCVEKEGGGGDRITYRTGNLKYIIFHLFYLF